MADITFKANPIHTNGELPAVGAQAPKFELVNTSLASKSLADYAGKRVILTINPSYDTGVCQATARAFNQKVGESADVVVLMVSADLPFAQKRFCEAEGLDHVEALSTYRSDFAKDWGLMMLDGPLQGLTARAVVVLSPEGKVLYRELVPEIVQEPDYDAALAALG
ncbi:MAG: thiol peroxidase [Deltaproteobacteria bacterium]|nr:thiol peroxidase [Deltaproteobacteria bacterium]